MYGANRPGAKVSQGFRDAFWRLSLQAGMPAAHDCIKAFSETDFRQDLKKIDVPTLVIHGDDDQIVPITVGGLRSSKMIKDATLKVYEGAPHGLMSTHQQRFNADLLAFRASAVDGRDRAAPLGRRARDRVSDALNGPGRSAAGADCPLCDRIGACVAALDAARTDTFSP